MESYAIIRKVTKVDPSSIVRLDDIQAAVGDFGRAGYPTSYKRVTIIKLWEDLLAVYGSSIAWEETDRGHRGPGSSSPATSYQGTIRGLKVKADADHLEVSFPNHYF